MSGERDFLDDFAEAEVADFGITEDVTQTPAEPISEQSSDQDKSEGDGPVRGPDGKFVKKEAEQVAEDVEKGVKDDLAEAPPAEGTETMVPVSVVQKMREEIKALKAQSEPKPKAPEFTPPQVDFQENPQAAIQGQLHAQKMQMSQFMAEQQNPDNPGIVAEAWAAFDQACKTDPQTAQLSQRLVNHPHPMGEVVKWHQQQSEVRLLKDAGGLDALIEAKLAERMAQLSPQPVANGNAQPNVPPSLAKRGGGAQTNEIASEKDDFDAFFKR